MKDTEHIAFNDGKLLIPIGPPIDPETMLANMASALARGLRDLKVCKPHDRVLSIASGGPSLADTYRDLQGDIAAVNGSLGFLLDHGIVPHFCGVMDATPHMADVVAADPRVYYLVASNCDPSLFDKLLAAGCDIRLWNPTPDNVGANLRQLTPNAEGFTLLGRDYPGKFMIGGGCTIGLRLVSLGYVMGYRKFHLHGMDSSFRGLATHAYPDRRDGAWAEHSSIEINGYRTSLNFIGQVTSFASMLGKMMLPPFEPVEFEVHGDGLLQSCYRFWLERKDEMPPSEAFQRCNIPRQLQKHEIRAKAILDRLPDGKVKGAEIGVFTGMLSAELLRRHDLELIMVDSWEGDGAAYNNKETAKDFHAHISASEQAAHRAAALYQTQFAEDRRTVLRARSVDGAHAVGDASLDFAFIDADHSYEGCRADIEAWWPKVKAGGLICGHDYGHPDFPGVEVAVCDFVSANGLTLDLGDNYTWFARKPA